MTQSQPDNEAIFHAARDIPDPDRRRKYVREACGDDEARIAHIEAMLAAADGPDSLLDRGRRCLPPPSAQTACWTVRRRPVSGRPSTSLPRRAPAR